MRKDTGDNTNRYPSDKFPKDLLNPDLAAKHEELINIISGDLEKFSKIGYRNESMFDWVLRVFENLSLSTVKDQYKSSLAITKTRLAIFGVLIDDLVDNINKRDFPLFEELIKIPFESHRINISKFSQEQTRYLNFTNEIWEEIINEVKTYPEYEKYKVAFEFDLRELFNGLEYGKFVNSFPNAVNITENDAYVHHGMFVLIQTDLDLMCSEKFNEDEYGLVRELSYLSQKMAKIGNLIGTYPRELLESDMSSEALVRFQRDYGSDFRFKINKILNRESRYPKFEEDLNSTWQTEYEMLKDIAKRIKSIDTERFLKEREFIQRAYMMKVDFW